LTLGLTPTSSSPKRASYHDRFVHTTMRDSAPIITFALTSGYREINSRTTGSASSCSSATDNKISKFGYSCLNEDSRFSKRLVSKPFKGRRMDTPGGEDGRVDRSGGLGRLLYRVRLSTNRVRVPHQEWTAIHSRGPAPE
jgi:hypothetical protein